MRIGNFTVFLQLFLQKTSVLHHLWPCMHSNPTHTMDSWRLKKKVESDVSVLMACCRSQLKNKLKASKLTQAGNKTVVSTLYACMAVDFKLDGGLNSTAVDCTLSPKTFGSRMPRPYLSASTR